MSLVKTLLLIDGAAGTGKTDMLEFLERKHRTLGEIGLLKKFTTRTRRTDEKERKLHLDLKFVTKKAFDKLSTDSDFYQYEYGGNSYGFSKEEVYKSLHKNRITVIIVRNNGVMRKLKDDFDSYQIVTVYVHTDESNVMDRLISDGYSKEYIKLRLERGQIAWEDYLKYFNLYDKVLLNNSSKVDFERIIENLIMNISEEPNDILIINGKNTFPLPDPLVGRKEMIVRQLHKYDYEKNVFLMMKFRDNNYDTWTFISETIQEKGFNCIRADQKGWNLTNDVYNPLAVLLCCKFGIALFDEPEEGALFNPNVAYELGIMHFQRKNCLILRHKSLPQMPFDLIHDLHKTYSRDIDLRKEVKGWLEDIENGH